MSRANLHREFPWGPFAAALFLPPLGIYLDGSHPAGGMDRAFWIGAALTVAFFLPGVVYAVATIVRRHNARMA